MPWPQFFITCARTDFLDGKHVVFGRLLDTESLLTVRARACALATAWAMLARPTRTCACPQMRKIENVPVVEGVKRPTLDIVVAECGEL
jgi:peptidyl-prolyl isomerase H (cyclophilin H)